MKTKKKKKEVSSTGDRVTFSEFFKVQFSVIEELLKKYKFKTVVLFLISIVTLSVSVIELKFVEYITNSVTSYFNGDISLFKMVVMSLVFILLIFIIQILSNISRKLQIKLGSDVGFDVRVKITNKLAEMPYEYYEFSGFYDKINFAREAGGTYIEAITGIAQVLNIGIMLITYSVLLSKISLVYICIIMLSLCLSIIISSKITEKRIVNRYVNLSPNDRRNAYFGNIMGSRINHLNIQTTRSFSYFANAYDKFNTLTRKAAIKESVMMFISEILISVMFATTYFITVMIVGEGIVSGKYEIGYFAMVVALLGNLFATVRNFSYYVVNHSGYVKCLKAYYEIMDINNTVYNETDVSSDYLVEVENVKYKYPQAQQDALRGVSISFSKGEKIAIVGHNGCGKSTLISLMLNLLKTKEGNVFNKDAVFSAVLQDFVQYQMTVKENIELGCAGVKLEDDKIYELLKKVELYDFITNLPNGIYTNLGQLDEDGIEMSKGQYQRLAICRLLANDTANVWILDEPTAFLDPLAEIETYKYIFDLADDRLVFFISHRLGFAKYADRIIVMDNGEIVEVGTHNELILRDKGIYKKMYEAQQDWYR